MSKKMKEHERIFKLYKAGFFNKVPMTEVQETMLKKHYPWIFQEKITVLDEFDNIST